ncbi:PEPxxWA-CTERM sorting domain-containing protein [Phenylobacterium sp.]|uniref:PEPxxWA-CTERM sorting domain-containing protein n=1 Tax=Phenylobacterium sp. TaxID=1871053 RepID=UPI00301C8964
MNKFLAAASVAALVVGAASSANAVVVITTATTADDLLGTSLLPGQVILEDFDAISDANVLYVGNVVTTTPDPITNSAPPPWSGGTTVGGATVPVDDTNYASVQGGTTATFSALNGFAFTSFSFYMGSPDEYNEVTFNFVGGGSQVFSGNSIWGGSPAGDGDRTAGYRIFYDFEGKKVSSITFASSQDAFEFDGLAGSLGVVPEPATWAMMIMGFGAAGTMLRSRRRVLA